jgi:endonuclease/exonuclease/phosphatase family metal-dependent hydrolase
MTATALMLEATRVFVAYLVFVVDQSRRVELGACALGVFAAIGLAGLLRRALGWRLAIVLTAAGLAGARLALQFWEMPEARVILGGLAIACWGWLLVPLLQSQRDAAALGILLGLALDTAIRIAFRTVDLPWMPGLAADGVTVVLAGVLVVSALVVSGLDSPPIERGPTLSLIAVGPGLAVFHLMSGNLGFAQATLDLDFPAAGGLLALGMVVGLLLSWLAAAPPSVAGARNWLRSPLAEGPVGVFILAAIGVFGLWFSWKAPGMSEDAYVFGVAGNIVLLALALLGSEPGRRPPVGGVALWLTLGMLLHAVLLFAYYTFTGPPWLIVVSWVLLLVGAFANGSRTPLAPTWHPTSLRGWYAVAAIVLLAVSIQQELTWSEPKVRSPLKGSVTVVTYNIQAGFSRDNIFDLEQTARTIEEAKPDIVILQEVGRGWLVLTGIDEVLWLSQRLEMPFYFGAASDDGLWGNAILTRAPVSDETLRKFTSSENLKRSAVSVSVATESGSIWVAATHLDNPDDASTVRMEQVEQLLTFWNERDPAIIAGDFNAPPESDVVQRMREAGFNDHADLLGRATTSEDERRIDYIFTTSGLDVSKASVGDRWTSDHLPVTATMMLRE